MKTKTPQVSVACPTVQETLAVIPGERPGTAIRVQVVSGRERSVRLEHLAFSRGVGWYTQRSFTIPAESLAALCPELRKAACLIAPAVGDSQARPMRIGPGLPGIFSIKPEPDKQRTAE